MRLWWWCVLFPFLLVSSTFLESLTFGGPWTTVVVMGLYLKSALAVGFFDLPSFFCFPLRYVVVSDYFPLILLGAYLSQRRRKEQFLQTLDISSIHDSTAQLLPPTSHLSKTVLHTSALPFQLRLTRCTVVCRIPRAPNVTLRLHPRTLLSGPDESFRFA
jgi:hypothetical protein